jgi:hypothetical protein
MSLCPRCGSVLDGPRENPKTRRFERKCAECLTWHDLPSAVQLAVMARRRLEMSAGGAGRRQ